MSAHIIDWSIVLLYLALTLGAGIMGRRFVSDVSGFLVAGRKLGLFVGIATLSAAEIRTITLMYYAQLGFRTGFASFVTGLISGAVMILIGRTGLVVGKLRQLGLLTIPEFFEKRYSRRLRVLTGVLVAVGGRVRNSRHVAALSFACSGFWLRCHRSSARRSSTGNRIPEEPEIRYWNAI